MAKASDTVTYTKRYETHQAATQTEAVAMATREASRQGYDLISVTDDVATDGAWVVKFAAPRPKSRGEF